MRSRRLAVLLVLLSLRAAPAGAQDLRGWATSTFRFLELRPLERVVVDPALLVEEGGQFFLDGEPVACGAAENCVLYRPAGVDGATVGTQDVGLTAWDLGTQGLSVTALLRGRARFGGDFVWPRSEDDLDALLLYAQLTRDRWRFRLGRQRTNSGLGFTGFDGASAMYTPGPFTLEAYGGRSLARGLAEPRDEALRGIENFVLDQDAYLLGGFVQGRFDGGTEVGLRYQREIWSDRSGLISERASLDARTDRLRPFHLRGSVDWDFGFGRVGKAALEVQRAFPSLGLSVALEGRRYVPYFELSTVWGFFSPVAYHEAMARVAWSGERVGAWARGGWRTYDEADVAEIFDPLEDHGWRAEVGGDVRLGPRWTVQGSYDVEWGVGAFLSAADARVRFRPRDRVDLSAYATTFQRIAEFRLGDGRVVGGGVDVGLQLREGLRLDGGAAIYRHDTDRPGEDVWNQTRVWSSLRIDFGEDPGRPRVRLRR